MSAGLDAVPGGVVALSDSLQILSANRGLGSIVGRDPAEMVGLAFDEILSMPSRILFQTHVYPALKADGRVEEVFLTLAAADTGGEPTPVLLNAVRTDGDPVAYEVLVVRILARARWEQDLLAATKAIERERAASEQLATELAAAAADLTEQQAERLRSQQFRDAFIGVVGHELRTPITTILGMSEILHQRFGAMEPAAVERHLAELVEESERLRRLTEDLLVLSRAEGGRLQLADDPIMIGHLVERVVESERSRVPDHAFTVRGPQRPAVVFGDEPFVEQVVRNLVGNATKYSPSGTTILVTTSDEADGVAVRVIDEGPGLGDQAPEALFDVFYRAPEAIRSTAGVGIGLFVCRELIRAMGGRIWAGSAPAPAAHGAEFGFWLPAADPEDGD